MAYDPQVVRAARETLEQRRNAAVAEANRRKTIQYARYPRLAEIEQEIAAAIPEVTKAILDGGDAAAIQAIRDNNLRLQAERRDILEKDGGGYTDFEPPFTCPLCKDTGFADGKVCSCHLKLLQEEACRLLSSLSNMQLTDFDTIDLSYYEDTPDPKLGNCSPRQRMADVVEYCKAYAENFTPNSQSLLMQGSTGLGKTHLSLAIAKAVVGKGFGVVYGSVHPLFRKLENEQFGRSTGNTEEQLIACDLLILDDLGMEFDSPFYRSSLYNLLNARLLEGHPTVISTNLSFSALQERYGDQIVSRIMGAYEPLLFAGKDIRQLIRRRAMR